MHREFHRWYSPALGRTMDLLQFGHAGARVLVFPTSQGRFYEWEDRGMVGALHQQLERGWLQLWCVDSVDAESWYARHKHPADRVRRHLQYESYLLHEVLPLTFHRNPNPFLVTTGTSFGAYQAANLAFRHPGLVGRMLGMSGMYDIKEQTDGWSNEDIYFNSPNDYLQNEHDPGRLAALRKIDIILVIGSDDRMRADNEWLSKVLWSKNIWHALRIWNGWNHDWPYWHQMVTKYIGGHD
jgi:esterase/lipase superfamily enzyme